jgi:hypothetical protein
MRYPAAAVTSLVLCLFLAVPAPLCAGQALDKKGEDAAAIVKGVTTEAEIDARFGADYDEITVTEPVTREDNQDFCLFLAERIPSNLDPVYPLPAGGQKARYYEFREGSDRMVLLVTLNAGSSLVEDSAVFRFSDPAAATAPDTK